jgi:hypothetical protein
MTETPPTGDQLLEAAAMYHDAGLVCIPFYGGSKRRDYDKLRATRHVTRLRIASVRAVCRRPASRADLERWFATPTNLGIATGHDNLVVIDFDDAALYERWRAAHGAIARTPTQRSGRGYHVLVRTKKRAPNARIFDEAGRHCGELLTDDVGIVVWPSVHGNGRRYTWVDGLAPWECGVRTVDDVSGIGLNLGDVQTGRRIGNVGRTLLRFSIRHLWRRFMYHAPTLPIVSRLIPERHKRLD